MKYTEKYVEKVIRERDELKKGLENLKGDETGRIKNWEALRVIPYRVLNKKIDSILKALS
jgi:hypothetical protein